MDKFIGDLTKGPRHALVEKLEREERELVEGEVGFEVRY